LSLCRFVLTCLVSNNLSMNDILASLTDPSLQSFRKSLATQQNSKSKSVGQKLSVPLARPLQQKLERQAAYEQTKTEITKWQPIVKANREVQNLSQTTLTTGGSLTISHERASKTVKANKCLSCRDIPSTLPPTNPISKRLIFSLLPHLKKILPNYYDNQESKMKKKSLHLKTWL
jgi:hypothetical protein